MSVVPGRNEAGHRRAVSPAGGVDIVAAGAVVVVPGGLDVLTQVFVLVVHTVIDHHHVDALAHDCRLLQTPLHVNVFIQRSLRSWFIGYRRCHWQPVILRPLIPALSIGWCLRQLFTKR